MTKICDELRLIFVRVPKTGSTSFLTSLKNAHHTYRQVGAGHGTALEARSLIGPGIWNTYTRIGFIRHPRFWIASYKKFLANTEPWREFIANMPTPYDWLADHKGDLLVNSVYRTEDMAKVTKAYGLQECHVNASNDLVTPPPDCDDLIAVKFARELSHY